MKLNLSEKISIINILIQEDRSEIRAEKAFLLNATYCTIAGIVSVTGFSISINSNVPFYSGIAGLCVCYSFVFLYFFFSLNDTRLCLNFREEHYRNLSKLFQEPFDPLKNIKDIKNDLKDKNKENEEDKESAFCPECRFLYLPVFVYMLALVAIFVFELSLPKTTNAQTVAKVECNHNNDGAS